MTNKNKTIDFSACSSSNINQETLKILSVYSCFQDKIKETRQLFGIPFGGFSIRKDKNSFYQKLENDSDNFIESPDFKTMWKKIHDQFDKEIINWRELQIKEQEINETIPLNGWGKSIKDICIHFGLHEGFQSYISNYILLDDFIGAPNNWDVQRFPNQRPEKTKIIIFGPILDEEMKTIFRMAIRMTSPYAGKFWRVNNPTPRIEEDINLLKFEETGREKSDQEIADELSGRTKFKPEASTPGKVSRATARRNAKYRVKKQIEKRFPKRHTFTT